MTQHDGMNKKLLVDAISSAEPVAAEEAVYESCIVGPSMVRSVVVRLRNGNAPQVRLPMPENGCRVRFAVPRSAR
jgi:hypothetical protein